MTPLSLYTAYRSTNTPPAGPWTTRGPLRSPLRGRLVDNGAGACSFQLAAMPANKHPSDCVRGPATTAPRNDSHVGNIACNDSHIGDIIPACGPGPATINNHGAMSRDND